MKNFSFIKTLFLFSVLILRFPSVLFSQELEPNVEVNMDKLNPDVRDRLSDFKRDVLDYLSKTKFTDEVIVNDVKNKPYKINCTFQFTFTGSSGFETYEAQVFIGSSRNIFRTPNYSPLLRILDEKWDFTYTKGQNFYHDKLRFNSLTSFLDYYSYMIIAWDDDSWEQNLGTKRYQHALDVCNLAAANAPNARGWNDFGALKLSRVTIPQEILNAKYRDFRNAVHMYHFAGIDSLQWGRRQALENIAESIKMISKVKKNEIRSQTIKAFFNAKHLEIAQTMVDYYDKSIYRLLMEADPDHASVYDEYSRK